MYSTNYDPFNSVSSLSMEDFRFSRSLNLGQSRDFFDHDLQLQHRFIMDQQQMLMQQYHHQQSLSRASIQNDSLSQSIPKIEMVAVEDKFGFIQACEKGIIKTARHIFHTNNEFYTNINQIYEASYGTTTTALIRASEKGRLSMVKFLIEDLRADIDGVDSNGSTALMKASFSGNLSIMQLLICKGANIHKRNLTGNSAIFFAAVSGNVEVVQYLIQHGANIQDQNDEGDTPLMRAVDLGCEHVVQYLIDHGANILIQNHSGKTAYKLARIKEIKLILGKRLLQLQRESDSAQLNFKRKRSLEEETSDNTYQREFANKTVRVETVSTGNVAESPLGILANLAFDSHPQPISSIVSKSNSLDMTLQSLHNGLIQDVPSVPSKLLADEESKTSGKETVREVDTLQRMGMIKVEEPISAAVNNEIPFSTSVSPKANTVRFAKHVEEEEIDWKQLYERELYLRAQSEHNMGLLMQENARLNSIIANYRMHMNSKHIPVEYIQLEVEHNTTGNYTNL